jgi:hypothetical protein
VGTRTGHGQRGADRQFAASLLKLAGHLAAEIGVRRWRLSGARDHFRVSGVERGEMRNLIGFVQGKLRPCPWSIGESVRAVHPAFSLCAG